MLKLHVPSLELFDNRTSEFITIHGGEVRLEHSLLSVYRWESKWEKPFLVPKPKTREESIDYIRCMVIESEIDPDLFSYFPDSILEQVDEYINRPMTATTFAKSDEPPSRDIVTAEILYWQMTVLGIPLEFEKRHLNHLLTLIKVCSIKNGPQKKMSKKEIFKQNRALNAARKKQFHTKG